MAKMKLEDLQRILFLDIETVSAYRSFSAMPAPWQELWEEKTRYQRGEESAEDFYPQRAAIQSEFGRVICISCGFFTWQDGAAQLRVKSFYGDDERQLLADFAELLRRLPRYFLAAHNGKEFDFPYLSRRMLVHAIDLPGQLDNSGKKPWEIPHLDTMELWKFGDYKHYTSLKLLAALFGIPTPKDDIDGSQVGAVYWQDNDLERIRIYCEKDVVTLAKVFLRLNNLMLEEPFTLTSLHE
jgi:hypothetical protein